MGMKNRAGVRMFEELDNEEWLDKIFDLHLLAEDDCKCMTARISLSINIHKRYNYLRLPFTIIVLIVICFDTIDGCVMDGRGMKTPGALFVLASDGVTRFVGFENLIFE